MKYIKKLSELSLDDVATVGGKTASLGQMFTALHAQGVRIPDGFAIVAQAYRYFLEYNKLTSKIQELVQRISDYTDYQHVHDIGQQIRSLIEAGEWPRDLADEIVQAYHTLSQEYQDTAISVAVRSSATAEDLPNASFAGQQETYLHIQGDATLLDASKRCFASLFTDRALVYRHEKGFEHIEVALSICVQKMVRSDLASSGVIFTLDTESGFQNVVAITAAYGLGESVVQGLVNPDEYFVYKQPMARDKTYPLLQKSCGNKAVKVVYRSDGGTETLPVPVADQKKFVLTDAEILELAHLSIIIEIYYSQRKGSWQPMDIEWAKDGTDGILYIVQARPETVHSAEKTLTLTRYRSTSHEKRTPLITGQSIGQKIVHGRAYIARDKSDLNNFKVGDILITTMTDPDWGPVMKQAAGIVTDLGGRTCHAAIVSRELGIPAVIGTSYATMVIKQGQEITLDASQGSIGYVYEGDVPFEKDVIDVAHIPKLPCKLMVNLADPESAFSASFLPIDGVGLARLEFIINNYIGVHPMAIAAYDTLTDVEVKKKIAERAYAYATARDFFVDTLSQGVAMIAAAFYPRPVIVRLSDFKSNEYRDLLGGSLFEPQEENPMIGWRGAARYSSASYEPAFALECAALKKAREEMGFTNIKIMVPFVRTMSEAEKTCAILKKQGIERGKQGLELYMMVEIPSNVILIEQFARYFDGFSIGSNDLTQLTLGVDRDSAILQELFDERDEAVKRMLAMAITGAHAAQKPIGICGQAPSDYPEIAEFLIQQKIDSMSLSVDVIVPFISRYT